MIKRTIKRVRNFKKDMVSLYKAIPKEIILGLIVYLFLVGYFELNNVLRIIIAIAIAIVLNALSLYQSYCKVRNQRREARNIEGKEKHWHY